MFAVGGLKSDVASLGTHSIAVWETTARAGKPGLIVATALAVVSGFAAGYYFGFDQRMDCKEGYAQALLKDPVFYRQVMEHRESPLDRALRRFRESL